MIVHEILTGDTSLYIYMFPYINMAMVKNYVIWNFEKNPQVIAIDYKYARRIDKTHNAISSATRVLMATLMLIVVWRSCWLHDRQQGVQIDCCHANLVRG